MWWWTAAWRIRRLWTSSNTAERAALLSGFGQFFRGHALDMNRGLVNLPAPVNFHCDEMSQVERQELKRFSHDFLLAHSLLAFGEALEQAGDAIAHPIPAPPARISALAPKERSLLLDLLLTWLTSMSLDPHIDPEVRNRAIHVCAMWTLANVMQGPQLAKGRLAAT